MEGHPFHSIYLDTYTHDEVNDNLTLSGKTSPLRKIPEIPTELKVKERQKKNQVSQDVYEDSFEENIGRSHEIGKK